MATYSHTSIRQGWKTLNAASNGLVRDPVLIVKTDDKSKLQGQANPALTGSLVWQFNPGWMDVTGISASYACEATTESPVGGYPIVPSVVDPDHKLANLRVTLCNGTLTVTSLASLSGTITDAMTTDPVEGASVLFSLNSITLIGDSITAPVPPINATAWVTRMPTYGHVWNKLVKHNFAISGQTTTQMVAAYATTAHTTLPKGDSTGYCFVWGGINDLFSSGEEATAVQIYANLLSLWASARADGYHVIATVPTSGAGFTGSNSVPYTLQWAEYHALVDLIVGDPTKYDHLFRPDVLCPTMDVPYGADGIHPSVTGADLIAGGLTTILDAETLAQGDPVTTDVDGHFLLEPADVGTYVLTASKTGYAGYASSNVAVAISEDKVWDFSMSPILASGMRFVLNWGATPRDIDLHIKTPSISGNVYHVYYMSKGHGGAGDNVVPYVKLDADGREGFGPETITIYRPQTGTYHLYVNNYKADVGNTGELPGCGATIGIYDSTGLLQSVTVPATGTGDWWDVATINGATGAITLINTLSNTGPSWS